MPPFCLVGGYKKLERNILPYSSLKKEEDYRVDRFSTIFGYNWWLPHTIPAHAAA
jgi:mannitol/fructose-specific phosphotransferase system IIA component (Ntr-type)